MKTHQGETPPNDGGTQPDEVAAQVEPSPAAKELSRLKDRHLRLAAEFENFRKRSAQETGRRAAAQKESFIRELLPVIDNLERALASNASSEQLRQGVQVTIQQLHQLLRQHGIEPEDSLGRPFDPLRHEAVGARLVPSQPDHAVLEVLQRGYRRGREIFRPAKVVVNDLNRAETNHHAG
jgi:molecular chaperone GrpE